MKSANASAYFTPEKQMTYHEKVATGRINDKNNLGIQFWKQSWNQILETILESNLPNIFLPRIVRLIAFHHTRTNYDSN